MVIIIHSNRWVHSFRSKGPNAFSLCAPHSLLISTAPINAASNYALIEITVSCIIRNPRFESFQMGEQGISQLMCFDEGACWRGDGTHLTPAESVYSGDVPWRRAADFWCCLCDMYPSFSRTDLSFAPACDDLWSVAMSAALCHNANMLILMVNACFFFLKVQS